MAAAEARAAWQRTANRCFMQEDAKRAPKLACCPNATSSKSQSDPSHSDTESGTDNSSSAFVPVNWNSSNINLSPDTRWWLQWQPNFGYQRDFTYEYVKDMKCETVDIQMEDEVPMSSKYDADCPENADRHEESSLDVFAGEKLSGGEQSASKNQDITFRTVESESVSMQKLHDNENAKEDPKSSYPEYWDQDYHWMTAKTEKYAISEGYEKYASNITTSKSCDKGGPWWRTADEDELATLVAQKSSDHIQNCDLPPPQSMRIKKGPLLTVDKITYGGFSECSGRYHKGFSESVGRNVSSFLKANEQTYTLPVSKSMDSPSLSVASHYPSTNDGERTSSSESTNKTWSESRLSFESDGDRAQLLEALCHSQTRAREAEKAAARAFSEKEQLLRLFLKEASHLFAYRQWIRLLQTETLCLQIKSNEESVSQDQLGALFPWRSMKHRQWAGSKASHNKRHKIGRKKFDITAWAIAVALGIGLAGAGLLLGWSMGWLLPMF